MRVGVEAACVYRGHGVEGVLRARAIEGVHVGVKMG